MADGKKAHLSSKQRGAINDDSDEDLPAALVGSCIKRTAMSSMQTISRPTRADFGVMIKKKRRSTRRRPMYTPNGQKRRLSSIQTSLLHGHNDQGKNKRSVKPGQKQKTAKVHWTDDKSPSTGSVGNCGGHTTVIAEPGSKPENGPMHVPLVTAPGLSLSNRHVPLTSLSNPLTLSEHLMLYRTKQLDKSELMTYSEFSKYAVMKSPHSQPLATCNQLGINAETRQKMGNICKQGVQLDFAPKRRMAVPIAAGGACDGGGREAEVAISGASPSGKNSLNNNNNTNSNNSKDLTEPILYHCGLCSFIVSCKTTYIQHVLTHSSDPDYGQRGGSQQPSEVRAPSNTTLTTTNVTSFSLQSQTASSPPPQVRPQRTKPTRTNTMTKVSSRATNDLDSLSPLADLTNRHNSKSVSVRSRRRKIKIPNL